MSYFKVPFIFCFLFTFCSILSSGRKYDVESEAMKLYGEDFKSVLRRFRKTPDYLKILNDKMKELKINFRELSLQALHYYHGKMVQRVGDIVGVDRTFTETEPTTTTIAPPPMYYHAMDGRRQETEEPNTDGVKRLDEYHIFNTELTVQERNSFRDLGFEFAGNLIHTMMQNMGPISESSQAKHSTRLPFGGETPDKSVITTTSEHPHTHEVTVGSTQDGPHHDETTMPPDVTTETFRFRNAWKRIESFFSKWE